MLKNRIQRLREQIPSWVDRRVSLLFLIVVVFTMAMAWGEPIPQAAAMRMGNSENAEQIIVQSEAQEDVQQGAFTPEIMANREQTNGVITGSVVLILIIIGASSSALYQKTREHSV